MNLSYCLSLQVILTCGPSEDPNDYNILDSLKVYGKTKETFGWPADDTTAGTSTKHE